MMTPHDTTPTPGDVRSAVADGRWAQAFEYAFALPDREVWQAYIEDHHKRRVWEKVTLGMFQKASLGERLILRDKMRGRSIITSDANFVRGAARFATEILPSKPSSTLGDLVHSWAQPFSSSFSGQEEAQASHARCLKKLSDPDSALSIHLCFDWIQKEEE